MLRQQCVFAQVLAGQHPCGSASDQSLLVTQDRRADRRADSVVCCLPRYLGLLGYSRGDSGDVYDTTRVELFYPVVVPDF